jgi:hypothetical protein
MGVYALLFRLGGHAEGVIGHFVFSLGPSRDFHDVSTHEIVLLSIEIRLALHFDPPVRLTWVL